MVGTAGRSGGNRQNGIDRTKPNGGPVKPQDLASEVDPIWDELLGQLPSHALRAIDVHELRLLCETLLMSRRLAEQVRLDPADHKAGRLLLNVVDRIHRMSAAFGLSPADRKRLDIEADELDEDDPFNELLVRMRGLQ